MKVLNFGSLNLDYVYTVDHMASPGETLNSLKREVFCGGKGLNQSIALAKAGVNVFQAGKVGPEGNMLLEAGRDAGVNMNFVEVGEIPTGHAIIQLDKNAQNSIILFGGANQSQTTEHIDKVMASFEEGDILLLQNEINNLKYIIDKAKSIGMSVVMNPSPFNDAIGRLDLSKIDMFLINEVEGLQMTGCKEPLEILDYMKENFAETKVVLTLGGEGAYYQQGDTRVFQNIYKVEVVDTTAAGDTFTGYFISEMIKGNTPENCLDIAAKASSIAVSRKGAAPSIPTYEEVK